MYRKPTHTDHYLHFESHHPLVHKMSVIRTLTSRAAALCSSPSLKKEELTHIFHALRSNDYPEKIIEKFSEQRVQPISAGNDDVKATITIPYILGTSDALRRVLSEVGVRVTFRPQATLRGLLVHPKDPVPSDMKANVVYNIPCQVCPKSYVYWANIQDTEN